MALCTFLEDHAVEYSMGSILMSIPELSSDRDEQTAYRVHMQLLRQPEAAVCLES